MSSHINALEDRVLVLQDKVDSAFLKAGFDPGQPRGEGGKWSVSGARAWLSQSKVAQAAKVGDYGERAKDLLATTAATIITQFPQGAGQGGGPEQEVIKGILMELSLNAKITVHEARERVSRVMNRLRAMRMREKPDVAKAEDEVLALLTGLIELLDSLELDDLGVLK